MKRQTIGEFELLVLLAAIRLGEDRAYPVSIVDEIEERAGRSARRAAVYVALQRLERKGLVTSALGAPLPERGGKARRYVRVEPAGVAAVREMRRSLEGMWADLDAVSGA